MEMIGIIVFVIVLIVVLVALRVRRKSKAQLRRDRSEIKPIPPWLIPVFRTLGMYLAFPYWATLAFIRPWRENTSVRAFARTALDPFLWLNTLWVIFPVIVGIYVIYRSVNWGIVVGLYIVAALLLHSAIAHSADATLERWEAGLDPMAKGK
jgi:hypothetical protein